MIEQGEQTPLEVVLIRASDWLCKAPAYNPFRFGVGGLAAQRSGVVLAGDGIEPTLSLLWLFRLSRSRRVCVRSMTSDHPL